MKPPDGTTAWITALSALGALAFAGLAGFATYGQLSVLKAEARQRAEDAHNGQARLVYWSEDDDALMLYNNSTEPVLNVMVCLHAPGGDYFRFHMFDLFPTGREGIKHEWLGPFLKAIRDKWAFTAFEAEGGVEGSYGGHPHQIDLIYTDSAGRRWLRNASMGLSEVAPDFIPPKRELGHGSNVILHPRRGVARPPMKNIAAGTIEISWEDRNAKDG